MDRQLILFGNGFAPPQSVEAAVLGDKAANLARMAQAGIAVPATAVLPVSLVDRFIRDPEASAAWLDASMEGILHRFGAADDDLLCVRPSPVFNVPGLLHTVLGLGQTPAGFAVHARAHGEAFAWRKRREMLQSYGEIAAGIGPEVFEEALEDLVEQGAGERALCAAAEAAYERESGSAFQAPRGQQIACAIRAAVASWLKARAQNYRDLHGLPHLGGLAVIIQKQVLADADERGGAGFAISRTMEDGAPRIHGMWVPVGPARRKLPLSLWQPEAAGRGEAALESLDPEAHAALSLLAQKLEATFHDAQRFEFVVGEGRVFAMSTEPARPPVKTAMRIACDLVERGMAQPDEALMRIDPLALEQLIHKTIDPMAKRDVIGTGLGASPGAASGHLVFSAAEAAARRAKGEPAIMVRTETSPEDVVGMAAADGVVTARGGLTSHAAVVARGMGKPCVTGAASLQIDSARRKLTSGSRVFSAGDMVTIDGTTGEILLGALPTVLPEISADFATVLGWADTHRALGIRANADTAAEARTARDFGAEGIGLCRTEHMFFKAERVAVMREMILAEDKQARDTALERLGPMQREDFEALFAIMAGLPVTIRLLDPPLHEFLPNREHEFVDTARALGVDVESLRIRVDAMREVNPMLGHRGCRLAISHPEILDMQARAIFEAALNTQARTGTVITPEIMVPFVCAAEEVRVVRARIEKMAERIERERGLKPQFKIGTMIELPRAALGADRIARECTFFSFGTNDLTQTTYGISRDDSSPFLALYRERGVFQSDPFQKFDVIGAGEMMRIATEKGRVSRPELTLAVCGEHGGEPGSIAFFDSLGLHYVSCSPYRVPIARLAAAQAAIARKARRN
ncbi:MAG: pyruvate, phosphate dikinase [Rhizobiaceae bacterium]|jgi:pyruvate,orthophosphate dikinase|nr:pyruvate, phosphate dikinase [Rhizobiaceae bacterium]